MMDLPCPRAIAGLLGKRRGGRFHYSAKYRYANREIGAPHQRAPVPLDRCGHLSQMRCPAGGSGHSRHAQFRQALEIGRSRFRRREFNRHVDLLESLFRQASAARVVELIQAQDHIEAVRWRHPFNQLTHFAVADNRHPDRIRVTRHKIPIRQSNTAGSSVEKNSSCNAFTTSTRSSSATTSPRLSSDAPWEIIWMFVPRMRSNALPAIPGVCLMFSPTRQTMLKPSTTRTSANCRSS